MRAKDREIQDKREIDKILNKAIACRIALSDNGQPYIVPVCFGYDGEALYFHSAKEGRKLDIIRTNPKVCVEAEVGAELVTGTDLCRDWSMKYRCVIGEGTAKILEDKSEKIRALTEIMLHYSDEKEFKFSDKQVDSAAVVKITLESLTGKKAG